MDPVLSISTVLATTDPKRCDVDSSKNVAPGAYIPAYVTDDEIYLNAVVSMPKIRTTVAGDGDG